MGDRLGTPGAVGFFYFSFDCFYAKIRVAIYCVSHQSSKLINQLVIRIVLPVVQMDTYAIIALSKLASRKCIVQGIAYSKA